MARDATADFLARRFLRGKQEPGCSRQWRHVARRVCFTALLGGGMCLLLSACSNLATMEFDANNAEALRYARRGDLQREVDSLVKPLIDQGVAPGAVVGVLLPDGSKQFFGYGVRDRAGGGTPNGDTLFAVGSLSKGFLGAITEVLVQEGKLSWGDTLEKLLPPETKLSADAKKITLLQLVTHTSGLPRQPYTREIMVPFLRYLFTGENFYSALDRPYVLQYLASYTAPSKVEYQYSNIGFGILGYALEQRTGLSVDTLLMQKIVKPLGLTNTGYIPEALPGYATRAHGYAGDQPKFIPRGEPVPDWQFTHFMRGSAALYSTARDLLTFAAAHLQGAATPFSAALTDTLQVRFSQPDETTAVAWTVADVDDQRIAYQLGIVAGYTGYLGLDLKHRTAVVILQNTFNWDESVGGRLLIRMGRAQDQWQQGRPVNARLSRPGPSE
jgi:CubicO group peptidase (beta-lactamase class C family)